MTLALKVELGDIAARHHIELPIEKVGIAGLVPLLACPAVFSRRFPAFTAGQASSGTLSNGLLTLAYLSKTT